jgi:hypothetical protein
MHNPYGGWSFHNDHIYPVAFYALSIGCPAVLVYPRTERDVDVAFEIGGVTVRLVTVVEPSPPRRVRRVGREGRAVLPEAVAV